MKTVTPYREIINNCLAVRVRIVARSVSAIYDQALAPYDVTIAQVTLLATVAEAAPCAPRKISEILQLEKSTVSRNLDLLVAKGLVEAVSSDGKGMREVGMTAAGFEKLKAVLPAWRAAQKEAGRLLGRSGIGAVHEAASAVWDTP